MLYFQPERSRSALNSKRPAGMSAAISTGDFEEALIALLGKSLPLRKAGDVDGLSASTS